MAFSPIDLGTTIQSLRSEIGLSQQELGERVGYGEGKGAAVSISRIENGHVSPSESRLAKFAEVFGIEVDDIRKQAESHSAESSFDSGEKPRKTLPFKKRLQNFELAVQERSHKVSQLAERFNELSELADESFLTNFLNTARTIQGAAIPNPPEDLNLEQANDPIAIAEYRLEHSSNLLAGALGGTAGAIGGSAVGGAAAFGSFTAVSAFGTASTGAAISGLSGAAASNAALAALGGGALSAGGAGIAGGVAVLAGIVATPALLLSVGGAIWLLRKNKLQQEEALNQLQHAEDELEASNKNYEALTNALDQANSILEHVGVHATRAHQRWSDDLPDTANRNWSKLSQTHRNKYDEFVTIAGALVTVSDMNFESFMKYADAELDEFIKVTSEILKQAEQKITNFV